MKTSRKTMVAIILSTIIIAAAVVEVRTDPQKYPLPPMGKKVVDRAVVVDAVMYAVVYESTGKWMLDIYDKPDKSWRWKKAFSAEYEKEAEDAIIVAVEDSSSVSFAVWQHLNVKPEQRVRYDRKKNKYSLVD